VVRDGQNGAFDPTEIRQPLGSGIDHPNGGMDLPEQERSERQNQMKLYYLPGSCALGPHIALECSEPPMIRAPAIEELGSLSELCLRSKAIWGYNEEFLEACRSELSFDQRDLHLTPIAVAEHGGEVVGVAQVKVIGNEADLLKLFVEPTALRHGVGRTLLSWVSNAAREKGATRLIIDSDPGAAPFYRRMGDYDLGQAPSGSIPGRMLPRLAINLCAAD
jgi:GNAT superfamily N-acetyltransferase